MNDTTLRKLLTFYEYLLTVRDPYEDGHSKRVCKYALHLANELKYSDSFLKGLAAGARFHDIGKLLCPAKLLTLPSVDTDELMMLQRHTLHGYMICQLLSIEYPLLQIIAQHHENYDGSGYYLKLAGEGIFEGARIVRICDSFDAMTSDRSYGIKRTKLEAIDELTRCGGFFDPKMLDVFINTVEMQ